MAKDNSRNYLVVRIVQKTEVISGVVENDQPQTKTTTVEECYAWCPSLREAKTKMNGIVIPGGGLEEKDRILLQRVNLKRRKR